MDIKKLTIILYISLFIMVLSVISDSVHSMYVREKQMKILKELSEKNETLIELLNSRKEY